MFGVFFGALILAPLSWALFRVVTRPVVTNPALEPWTLVDVLNCPLFKKWFVDLLLTYSIQPPISVVIPLLLRVDGLAILESSGHESAQLTLLWTGKLSIEQLGTAPELL